MTMTATQQRYAVERISQIERAKISALDTRDPAYYRTFDSGLLQETLKLKSKTFTLRSTIAEVFDVKFVRTLVERDHKAMQSTANRIKREAQVIKDHIMLGEASEALAMIEKFARAG